MSLHSGLLWLANGYAKQNLLKEIPTKDDRYNNKVAGDAGDSNCPKTAFHKLRFEDSKTYNEKRDHPNRRPRGSVPKPRPARTYNSLSSKIKPSPPKIRPSSAVTHRRPDGDAPSVPVAPPDLSPRAGAWTTSRATASASKAHTTKYEKRYEDLPAHPDLRFFDRHSRCYNKPHCNTALTRCRPRTACAAGRVSLEQCECCGEITSILRYTYGPTGSAMASMDPGNKTFLYPEGVFSYDSYSGRRQQRPASAPGRSTRRPHSAVQVRLIIDRTHRPHIYILARTCRFVIY